jgi:hypothetical protein
MERPGGDLLKAGVSSVAGMASITAISKQMGQSLATMDLQNQVLLLLLLLCLCQCQSLCLCLYLCLSLFITDPLHNLCHSNPFFL